jgi:LacI family transcriptional regulator
LREGLSENGIAIEPQALWFGLSYSREAGVEYARAFLALAPSERPTAVVLGNDPMALGFMRAVLQQGVLVPGDVSVVGFDGTPDGEQFWPGLTSVLQPTQQMAISACEALLERIDRRHQEGGTSVEFAVQMLARESTGAPRA